MEITKFITKSLLIRRLQFDLPHANDARDLLGYLADRMTDRSMDGTRLCTAHVDFYFPRNYPEVTCSATQLERPNGNNAQIEAPRGG